MTERCNFLSQQVFESESASSSVIQDLRSQLKETKDAWSQDKVQLNELLGQINELQSSNESSVRDLAEALNTAERYRSELDGALSMLKQRDAVVSDLEESLRISTEKSTNFEAQLSRASTNSLASASLNGAPAATARLASPPKRLPGSKVISILNSPDDSEENVLKNYMKNQLDLQETEWENYEETINNLAGQLEVSNQQIDKHQATIKSLVSERDELLIQLATHNKNEVSSPGQNALSVNVDIPTTKVPNQPSSMRSYISLDVSSTGDPSSPHQNFSSFQFDYSLIDSSEMAEQVEQFKAHVEQQVILNVGVPYYLWF